MEILNDLVELLTVDNETDVHERSTLGNHVNVRPLQRRERPLEHTVKTHDVLTDD